MIKGIGAITSLVVVGTAGAATATTGAATAGAVTSGASTSVLKPGTVVVPLTATSGHFARPVPGAVITQGFGCTPYPFEPVDRSCASGHWHSGIDLAAEAGSPVHATLGGTAHVFVSTVGYGLHVVVDHGAGLSSLYGHLSTLDVLEGQPVAAEGVIGAVGSTGNSTGPHLHFEIRRDGIPEDPRIDLTLP